MKEDGSGNDMKRILAFLLVLVTLFTLVACTKEPEEEYVPEVKANAKEGDVFAERAAIDDELGSYNFNGRKFRIVGTKAHDSYVEKGNTGNLITDAKFNRNKTVETRFNTEIEMAYTGTYSEVVEWVSKTVLSGSDEFDLFASHTASVASLVLKNLFINWYDVPNVDFSKPWWSSSCADELTYDGKCILAVSDFNYSAIATAYCVIYNKELAAAYDLGNLYQVVLNGDWTIDYFYDLVKDIYIDSDGSGDRTDGDFYGFAQSAKHQCADSAWLWAFDNPIIKKNADGVPELAVKTEKVNNIVSTLYDLFFNTTGVHYKVGNEDPQGLTMLLNKQAIFATSTIDAPTYENLRNFDADYGILPYPKWDENQVSYKTMASGDHTVLAVPKTVKDTEFVGTVIEALSAESYKQVTPTLYEIALKTRYLRDNESKEVLDILIDGRIYDFGYIYDGWQGFGFMIGAMMNDGNSNFESYYNKRYGNAKIHFKRIVKVFDKLG